VTEAVVLFSTLPELPGYDLTDVKGLVCEYAALGAMGGGKTRKLLDSMADQARRLGADAIVDVKTVIGGDTGICVMTGTAVRTTPRAGR
jgi:uncharacterized protein YbjQ (UPF0145 family)